MRLSKRLSRQIRDDLRRHEGVRHKPYRDSLGVLTIGIGRNLERGLSKEEIEYLFLCDIANVQNQVTKLAVWPKLSDDRRAVLFNMAFQLGFRGLLNFRRMLDALGADDYERAADEMLDSRWAEQTPERAHELAAIMRTGRRPRGKS